MELKKLIYVILALTLISVLVDIFISDKPSESTGSSDSLSSSVSSTTEDDNVQDSLIEIKSFDDLYKRAKEVSSQSSDLDGAEKISFITKKVTEDVPSELDKTIILDALSYLINEYEIEKFNLNAPVNLYITRLVDKQLDKYNDMLDADNMVFDMFQICKDIIRMTSDNMDETTHSISVNQEQINKIIDSVKISLQ